MTVKTEIIFTDEDFELLSKKIPKSPCLKCDERGCCGCPDERYYHEKIKPYKDAGIFEYAETIRKIRNMNDDIKNLKRKINELINSLPDEITRNQDIKFKNWEI